MADVIRAWLDETGHSKTWLADELGISRPTLYARLDDGKWDLESASKVARLVGCTIEDLCKKEGIS